MYQYSQIFWNMFLIINTACTAKRGHQPSCANLDLIIKLWPASQSDYGRNFQILSKNREAFFFILNRHVKFAFSTPIQVTLWLKIGKNMLKLNRNQLFQISGCLEPRENSEFETHKLSWVWKKVHKSLLQSFYNKTCIWFHRFPQPIVL